MASTHGGAGMRVLVTGATGFIGSHTAAALVAGRRTATPSSASSSTAYGPNSPHLDLRIRGAISGIARLDADEVDATVPRKGFGGRCSTSA